MRKIVIFSIALVLFQNAFAQVGINTENPETTLDVRALNHEGSVSSTDGVTVPRVSDLVASGVANGQLVYLIADNGSFNKGFHYWDGSEWQPLNTNDGDAWNVDSEDTSSAIVRTGKVSIGTTNSSGILNTDGQVFHTNISDAPTSAEHYLLSIDKTSGEIYYLPWGGIDPYVWGNGSDLDNQMDIWDGANNTSSGLTISGQTSGHLVFNVIANENQDGFIFKSQNDVLAAKIWATTGNFRIKGNATKPGGGAWLAPSDRRIKKNIESFTDGLNIVNQLNPVTFEYNGKGGTQDNGKKFVGFIAQEVEEVAPYMVQTSEDPSEDIKDLKVIDDTALNKILVNAIQELTARVEKLEAENKKLREEK